MRKRWYTHPLSDDHHDLAKTLNISDVAAQLLINRNVTDEASARMMLSPSLSALYSPLLLPDIHAAMERIHRAEKNHEHIMLCGDYDVDGITSLTMLISYLKSKPVTIKTYIPHRIKEGYGLKDAAIQEAIHNKVTLIICVDCGTNSFDQIDKALKHHIDVIIIDHHKVTSPHPKAILINPKRKDSTYPFHELCSGALAFKVVQALSDSDAHHLLDLAVLATIADVAPLIGENRIIVKEGLTHLKNTKNRGLIELMKKAKVKAENVSTFHIGFLLGPRLNASGRISTAYESLQLLLEEDEKTANGLADALHKLNAERQKIGNDAYKQAVAKVEQTTDFSKDSVIVAHGNWHPGIIGIVASRISDLYNRPTFIISFLDGSKTGKGSGRSIEHFNMTEALEQCSSLLINFGGHEQAAGIEIAYEQIPAFKEALNALAKESLSGEKMIPQLSIDYELSFGSISRDLIKEIDAFRPFGEGNPAPLFLTKKMTCRTAPRRIENERYSLYVTDGKSVYEALISESSGLMTILAEHKIFDCVYYLTQRMYDGHEQITLQIVDARSSV